MRSWFLLVELQKASDSTDRSQSLLNEVLVPTEKFLETLRRLRSSQSLLNEVLVPTPRQRHRNLKTSSQSLLNEVLVPTCYRWRTGWQCSRSQSLLNEVLVPTPKQQISYSINTVAIPSKWGLGSYASSRSCAWNDTAVAIPSKWGLGSYEYLRMRYLQKITDVAIPSKWGLGSYVLWVWGSAQGRGSQSLLNEVLDPTTALYGTVPRQPVAIPSKWGLGSYDIAYDLWHKLIVAIHSKWGLGSYGEVKKAGLKYCVAIPSKWGLGSYWGRGRGRRIEQRRNPF